MYSLYIDITKELFSKHKKHRFSRLKKRHHVAFSHIEWEPKLAIKRYLSKVEGAAPTVSRYFLLRVNMSADGRRAVGIRLVDRLRRLKGCEKQLRSYGSPALPGRFGWPRVVRQRVQDKN